MPQKYKMVKVKPLRKKRSKIRRDRAQTAGTQQARDHMEFVRSFMHKKKYPM